MTPPIIHTQSLTRDFKNTRAVDALNLDIQPGELFGLVGPDGAGKTTTLRILAGLLDITGGEASVAGHDLGKDAESVKPLVGYMAQQFGMYGELSVKENLTFFADLYDVPRSEMAARTERLLSFAGLTEFTDRRATHLSGGMQKKLALACTLIHEPQILLLDEPTTGVDPVSRREFWNILSELHAEGTTILVCTPYMDEADRCSMVGLMYEGRLVECAPPEEIYAMVEGEMIEILPEDWQAAQAMVETIPGVLEVQTYGESLHILVDNARTRLPKIKRSLKKAGIAHHGIRSAPIRMEEAFISLIRNLEK